MRHGQLSVLDIFVFRLVTRSYCAYIRVLSRGVLNFGPCYRFGGKDGLYHYNDTWIFDTNTRVWTEMACIGYIPPPREGHAAALVEDVMYVFGGRGVDGNDLGDLYAFKLSSMSYDIRVGFVAHHYSGQRWYMHRETGPTPAARSGHAMTSMGTRIFVLGGWAGQLLNTARSDDPSIIHVLDTRTYFPFPAAHI